MTGKPLEHGMNDPTVELGGKVVALGGGQKSTGEHDVSFFVFHPQQ